MTDTADVIVIGAGVQGASLAFHLASRGASVIVLEQATAASGATGRSSGLVRVYYDLLAEAKLAWESQALVRRLGRRASAATAGSRAPGFVWIEPRPSASSASARTRASHRAMGVDSSVLDADGIRRARSRRSTSTDEVAAYEPDSGYADPFMTAAGFLVGRQAERARAWFPGREVSAIRTAGGRVEGVDTNRGSVDAPVIVNAAGAWAGRVAALVGLDIPITVWRHDTGYLGVPATVDRPDPGRHRQRQQHVLPARGRGHGARRPRGRQPDGRLAGSRHRRGGAGLPRPRHGADHPPRPGPHRRHLPHLATAARTASRRTSDRSWARPAPTASTSTAATAARASRPRRPSASDGRADPGRQRRRPSISRRSRRGASRRAPLVGEHGEEKIWR